MCQQNEIILKRFKVSHPTEFKSPPQKNVICLITITRHISSILIQFHFILYW